MRDRCATALGSLTLTLLCFARPALAEAPTKVECADADMQAQSLRRSGALDAARAHLRICSDPTCPTLLRDDCAQRTDELERAQPTIVFDAKDGAGHDLTALKVSVDGRVLAEKLDGSALAVNPGDHFFSFEMDGQEPVTKRWLIREGEKGRREEVVIGAAPAAPVAPALEVPALRPVLPPEDDHVAVAPSRGTVQWVAGIAAGGLGIVGVAVGAVFGLKASADFVQQRIDCPPPGCNSSNHALAVTAHNDAVNEGTISTVGFVAGGVLLAGGIALILTAPSGGSSGTHALLRFEPTRGGGAVILQGALW